MRQFALVCLLAFAVQIHASDEDACYVSVGQHCSSKPPDEKFYPCSSLFSGVHAVMGELQTYVAEHLLNSYQYLLMSANFANYERQRDGFAKLFKKLSDDTWDDAIDLIKFMTKRGGSMNFTRGVLESAIHKPTTPENLEITEPQSLSLALGMYKVLANKAHKIHGLATKRSHNNMEIHDADVISFIENKFVSKHTDIIRELTGHSNDLMNLIKTANKESYQTTTPNQAGLSIYLFDEYLKSLY